MNPLKLKDQWGILKQKKMAGSDCVVQFLKKLKLHTRLVPETVH